MKKRVYGFCYVHHYNSNYEIGIYHRQSLILRSHYVWLNEIDMQSIAESIVTPYTGSEATRDAVRAQIAERFGDEEAKKYDPYTNARTYAQWIKLGYRVKKAQTALRSTTFLDAKNQRGEAIKIPRTVCLYYQLQVERV